MNFKYKKQNQELRREKVLELTAMGFNQRAISTKLVAAIL
jgi:hypothetical protein